jgi:DNA-binding IclR family transcriptional regulator
MTLPAGSLIDRVFDIIELLADYPEGLAVSELARRLRMPKSEAHRLLATFIKRGFALKDEPTQHYRLSVRTAAIGHRFFGKIRLEQLCQPTLDRLAMRAGELTRLALIDPSGLIFVANAQGASSGLRYDAELGRPLTTLHGTANGRAWLATLDEDEAVALVKSRSFILPAGYDHSVVTDEASLRAELGLTRTRGYALSLEESVAGIASIAVAIRDRGDGSTIGTVSLSGPTVRLTPARIAELAPDVQAAARELAELWPLRSPAAA